MSVSELCWHFDVNWTEDVIRSNRGILSGCTKTPSALQHFQMQHPVNTASNSRAGS